MQSPRMPKDKEQALAVEALIESRNNPFVGNQDLNSISTAKDAPVDMSYDLLHPCGIENKNSSNSRRKGFKAPLLRRSFMIP